MPNRKRNQPGIFTHAAQDYSQPMRSRGESIYGTDSDDGNNYDGEAFHSPRRPVASPYSDRDQEWRNRSSFYDEQDRRDFSNYGTGGYYGSTYNQHEEWNERPGGSLNRGDGYRGSDERSNIGRDERYGIGCRYNSDDRYNVGRNYGERREPNEGGRFTSFNSPYGSRQEQSGAHRGKGPRGYQRADDRIRDDVNDRLADDSYLDATEIEVVVLNGEVTLSGTVDSRSDKRRAEDLSESVGGVKNVENRIRVKEIFGDQSRSRGGNDGDTSESPRKRNAGAETSRIYS
ncbi:BON domain-containing protein [Chryseolinea sp. T2]|uniref:BON domain-containing protein n=1 Tax=Chryseolinea sp. T2 TaxID=3129255 RepID=UPI003077E546